MKTPYKEELIENGLIVRWDGMVADNEGASLDCVLLDLKTVSFEGDFGGALAVMEGKIGNVWFPMVDTDGAPISAGAEAMMHIQGRYRQVRPVIMGGDKISITTWLFCETIPKRRLGR